MLYEDSKQRELAKPLAVGTTVEFKWKEARRTGVVSGVFADGLLQVQLPNPRDPSATVEFSKPIKATKVRRVVKAFSRDPAWVKAAATVSEFPEEEVILHLV